MSEKNKAGLNEVDMQAVVAAWIVAHNGCTGSNGGVSCSGTSGFFKGAPCPLKLKMAGVCPCESVEQRAVFAKEWLEKYHQQKAEAAEAEKRKVEAARKDEQHDKGKSVSCGNCANFSLWSSDFGEDMKTSRCAKKGSHVPAGFTGCPDFEPRAKAKRGDEDECHADAIIYNGILISTPSQEDKLRHKAWLLEIENSHILNDIERLKAEAAKRTAEDAERISRLEKEKAELLEGRERLIEQRNRLSIDLVKATRREKDVEREKDIIAKKLVDFTAKWNDLGGVCTEKDGLIDRLRKENAELRSWYEQLKKDSFHRLFEALCKAKVLEKQIDRLLGDQLLMERKMQICISAC